MYLELLLNHSHLESIAAILPLYLCIESSKNIPLPEDKVIMKINVIRGIMSRIEVERVVNDIDKLNLVENLSLVLRDVVEKYYLIAQGKAMLEVILEDKYVEIVIAMIREAN